MVKCIKASIIRNASFMGVYPWSLESPRKTFTANLYELLSIHSHTIHCAICLFGWIEFLHWHCNCDTQSFQAGPKVVPRDFNRQSAKEDIDPGKSLPIKVVA